MSREKITLTAEFRAAVKKYQKANNFKSFATTLVFLAGLGYKQETGDEPPGPLATWGGDRRSK